jgi:tRNAThr (cytosine32-N3)-methyltransferase
VILIFIFSALNPAQWNRALHNIYRVLKPGGRVLFRDYGRGDLAQVRFKKGRYMGENFYVRGDGTRVYFFDKDELIQMWSRWTLEKGLQVDTESTEESQPAEPDAPFEVVHMGVDRRLLVNRSSKLKMYRCWMQGHFRKRDDSVPTTAETGQ